MTPIYESDPGARPDDEFEPGALRHLAAGARGRLLDGRRTPVSVVEVQVEIGFVLIRIEGFEDAGAIWQIPLEQVNHYQFEPGGPGASAEAVARMEAAIGRFAHEIVIEAREEDRERTEVRIGERQAETSRWLLDRSRFVAEGRALPDPATRRGDPILAADFERYAREHEVWGLEDTFARMFVSNPGSGEVVKGHRIVLAELGLAGYSGPQVRDPATFADPWNRERRAEHIVTRLAFMRGLFGHLALTDLLLWRGFSTDSRIERRDGRTFVSTSFDEAVARSHYEGGTAGSTRGLVCRDVPVGRIFMTYLETAAMNTVFLEAEAAVLDHPDDRWP